jgi:hypothetical protein
MKATYRFLIIVILVTNIFPATFALPATGAYFPTAFSNNSSNPAASASGILSLQAFIDSVANGSNQVTGVYVEGLFAYRVLQTGNAAPGGAGVVGQYAQARRNIGLLAHNYAAGAKFYELTPGMKIKVIYGNRKIKTFTVKAVERYQASDPNDYGAPFIQTQTGKQLTAKALFNKMYSSGLTFQTCITQNGTSTWGLLFVRAK